MSEEKEETPQSTANRGTPTDSETVSLEKNTPNTPGDESQETAATAESDHSMSPVETAKNDSEPERRGRASRY